MVGCSPFHLSRTFSAEMGMTIPQYLRQIRMERAADLLKSGKFNVTAEIAAMGSGSFEIIVGDQKLKGTAPKTGDYGKYQKVALGTIELSAPGKTSLAVKAIQEGWQPFNLRSLKFAPAK